MNVLNRKRPIAIVTDGMWRKSLSAIRSLGKAGYSVHVLGESWLTVGFWSRYTARRVRLPDAKDDPAAFGAALTRYLQSLQAETADGAKPVLLAMEEESLRYLIENAESLRAFATFLIPDRGAFEISADKSATLELAAQSGVPVPRTHVAASGEVLCGTIADMGESDYVVKPMHGAGSRGVRYGPRFSADEARRYLTSFGPALVQERIPARGDAIGVSVLFDENGDTLAHFVHKRLRQFPNSGGPSTDRIGIADDHLLALSLRLLRGLAWKGVAMVEWKVDPRSGQARLMEINPRFWGSLELAVRSGVDFPVLYARAAAGVLQSAPVPILGIRCRWLIPGEVLRWFTADKSERETLGSFCRGLPVQAEEWDATDLRGFLACIICQGLAVLMPKYRRMLDR